MTAGTGGRRRGSGGEVAWLILGNCVFVAVQFQWKVDLPLASVEFAICVDAQALNFGRVFKSFRRQPGTVPQFGVGSENRNVTAVIQLRLAVMFSFPQKKSLAPLVPQAALEPAPPLCNRGAD